MLKTGVDENGVRFQVKCFFINVFLATAFDPCNAARSHCIFSDVLMQLTKCVHVHIRVLTAGGDCAQLSHARGVPCGGHHPVVSDLLAGSCKRAGAK